MKIRLIILAVALSSAAQACSCKAIGPKEALHLRNVAREVFARRRALANLGDCRIASADSEHRASTGLRLNRRDRRSGHRGMTSHWIGDRSAQLQMFGGMSGEAQLRVRVRRQVLSVDNPDSIEAALFDHSRHLRKRTGNREGDHPYFRLVLVHWPRPAEEPIAAGRVSTTARKRGGMKCSRASFSILLL